MPARAPEGRRATATQRSRASQRSSRRGNRRSPRKCTARRIAGRPSIARMRGIELPRMQREDRGPSAAAEARPRPRRGATRTEPGTATRPRAAADGRGSRPVRGGISTRDQPSRSIRCGPRGLSGLPSGAQRASSRRRSGIPPRRARGSASASALRIDHSAARWVASVAAAGRLDGLRARGAGRPGTPTRVISSARQCRSPWTPISWPASAAASRTRRGCRRAIQPRKKTVAR